ncbi:MAG: hypothetical protein CMN75_03160 [Spirochaeta sp.]|nr:hypothetical protein [Spirochaeta sp.]RPG07603.1 MAG: DUF2470 domain-containing protein [Proteobacteria bacterium TMED72]
MSNDAHSQPAKKSQDLLYDPDVAALSHAERARTLADQVHVATLCTVSTEEAAYPYGSFVTFAMDGGRPTFFISELAEHTRNLHKDTRASLMIAESGGPDPLANSRVTLLGHVKQITDEDERERAKAAYLKTHPSAAHYIDYSDFSFWQLEVDSLRYIGGYGRMSWVQGEEWASSEADVVAEFAEGIIQHMNEDHQNAMVEYCQAFSKATDTSAATMTGVDRYGFEMSAETAAGPRPIRLAFASPISTSEEARKEMVRLVREARQTLTQHQS